MQDEETRIFKTLNKDPGRTQNDQIQAWNYFIVFFIN